ncbi:MAG: hypothetical protein KGQ26_10600 [Rhodospirillales bacterium]|nr:hypothetical protein [Rhodospirillales bacterium]
MKIQQAIHKAKAFRGFQLWQDRRAATAVMWALMLPTMIVAGGAGVDFARISAERVQLQSAADQAAQAGVGAYANDINAGNGASVASAAFNQAFAGISGAVSLQGIPSITLGCTGTSSTTCGTSGTFTESSTACSEGTYCTTVSATARQTNSIFYFHLPFENMSVTATAQYVTGNPGANEGQTTDFSDYFQSSYSANRGGGGQVGGTHTSGTGSGVPGNTSNSYKNVVYFIDGMNNAPPPVSFVAPSSTIYTCNNPSITTGSSGTKLIPTGSSNIYCSPTLGNPPTQEWYFVNGSSNRTNPLYVQGALNISPETVVCPEHLKYSSYTGAKVNIQNPCQTGGYNYANSYGGYGYYTPLYFTTSINGNYSVDITPATGNSGVITYVNDEYDDISMKNSSAIEEEYSYLCPTGTTSCYSPITGDPLYFTGPGTWISHDTYITQITVVNGYDTAWTETETFAVKSTGSQICNLYYNYCGYAFTETAQAGGGYDGNGNPQADYSTQSTNTSASYSPSSYARDPSTDTSGLGSTTDAYSQLDNACSNAAKNGGKLGGDTSVGGTLQPQSFSNLADIFAMTTDAPPSSSPPIAYNFTDPNYGYSYVTADEAGSALETETAYFCGNGSGLQISGGSATGLTVTPTSPSGAVLTN